jgi:L-fuculose-phosphate aldolase
MPVAPLPKVRAEVVATSRRLHENGWVANHDGNLSVRLNGGRLLITPTATSKRDVEDSMLIVVDMTGKVLEGRKKPFSELQSHLAIYRARPEAEAVLHAHPPYSTAYGLVGAELSPIAIPEVVVSLGPRIPTIKRDDVEACAREHDAMILQGNGVFTLGADLNQALLRMELVEHYAKILSIARGLGSVASLSEAEVGKLLEARKKAGLGPKPR